MVTMTGLEGWLELYNVALASIILIIVCKWSKNLRGQKIEYPLYYLIIGVALVMLRELVGALMGFFKVDWLFLFIVLGSVSIGSFAYGFYLLHKEFKKPETADSIKSMVLDMKKAEEEFKHSGIPKLELKSQ